jgi:tetratricopeptide (TPR) repeat protein
MAVVTARCEARRCGEAILLLERALRDQSGNAELYHQIGICYSGACRSHPLVSLPLAIPYLMRAVSLIGTTGPATLRAKYLDSLGNVYLANHQPEEAILRLEEAARMYRGLGLEDEWAREQYNLGNACCDLPKVEAPEKWARAVQHYRNALQVRTRQHDPLRFAATMQNLGTAYRELPSPDRNFNVRRAIDCYCAAMRIYAHAQLREKCAALQNNLGNAYLCLSAGPVTTRKYVHRAVRYFAKSLEIRSKNQRPCDYAVTQFNRGQGYLRLAAIEPGDGLRQAAECLQEAVEGFILCGNSAHAEIARAQLSLFAPFPHSHGA